MTNLRPPTPPASATRVSPGATAVVFAGGDPLDDHDLGRLRAAVRASAPPPVAVHVVAADSGLHVAEAGGWVPDLVVGDFDSVDPAALERAEAAGAELDRHPSAKAATDLELALDGAMAAGAGRIIVAGGHGGRLDHLLANVLLLGSDRYATVDVSAVLGPAWVQIVRRRSDWVAERGGLVTLLALHGPVAGVTTRGLLYPLHRATLHPGSTRGVSNEHLDRQASVEVESGVLAVVVPGQEGSHVRAADVAALARDASGADAFGPGRSEVTPDPPADPSRPSR